jgi:hypothetical protein
MNTFSKTVFFAGGLSLLAGAAWALPGAASVAPQPPSTAQAGPKSFDDMKATGTARFKALDTDGDDRISRAEFALGSPQLLPGDTRAAGETSKDAPHNAGDRKDSPANFSGGSNSFERFSQLDTDKDGFLSPSELAAPPGQSVNR